MKIAAIMFSGLAALLAAQGAQARGIDCAKTGTRLEATICADPEMRDYDNRIAAAYARGLAIWDGAIADYVRRDQQEWLTGFRSIERLEAAVEGDCVITDLACIRGEMRRRVDVLESGAYVHSGVYRAANGMKLLLQTGRANGYGVRVYDPKALPKGNIVTLDTDRAALWDGPEAMVSIMGDSNGLPLAASDGCTLRLSPEPLAIHVVQKGACGGRNYEGAYGRLLDDTLRSYELELY